MHKAIPLFLLLGSLVPARAQITWSPCTMPVNTLTLLTVGPNGELVTLLPTNPAQPSVSNDHGQTWQPHAGTGGPNGMFLSDACLHVTNGGSILIWGTVGGDYLIWRSADGGETFAQLGTVAGVPAGRFFFGFTSGPNGDVFMYGDGVIRSTDDGQTWTSIVGAQTVISALTANSTTLYGAQFSAIYRGALDGSGFTGSNTSGVFVTDGRDLARGMNERIIAVGGDDKVITTWDDGNLWWTANAGLGTVPAEWEHVAASLSSDSWVIGKQISVRFTNDAGASWVTAETGLELAPNEPIQDIFCDSTGIFYLYGYFHLYRSEISTGIANAPLLSALHVAPNPTAGLVRVSGYLPGSTCLVIDATGREVLRATVGSDGTIDLSGLENGRYVLRSSTGPGFVQVHLLQ